MSRRADELDPQLQDIDAQRDARNVPEGYTLTPQAARAGLESRLDGMLGYIDDEVAEVQDLEIEGPDGPLSIRTFHPTGDGPHPIVVFYHGGGFVMGSLDSHENICQALAARAGVLVVSVDYRLAPEDRFPAAVHDAYAALEWVAAHGAQLDGDPDRLAVAGDSAGGNLAAVVSMLARDRDGPAIDRQLLVYPWLDPAGRFELDSYVENADDDGGGNWLLECYAPDDVHTENGYLAPLIAHDLSDLPPATIVVAGYDALRDEGFRFAQRLDDAGVATSLRNYEAMNHGFLSLLGLVDRADEAMAALGDDLQTTFA